MSIDTTGPIDLTAFREGFARMGAPSGGRVLVPFALTDHMPLIVQRLDAAIMVLPRDAERVADKLASWGIRGETCGSGSCPLAVYFTARCGHEILVCGREVQASGPGWEFTYKLPAHLRSFVVGFDANEWPYLVRDWSPDA